MCIQNLVKALLLSLFLTGVAAANNTKPQVPSRPETRSWTQLPLIVPAKGRSRKLAKLQPVNYSIDEMSVYPSVEPKDKGKSWQAKVENNTAGVQAQGKGGYHWVTGTEQRQGQLVSASTIHYFSNPGPAPRTMLATPKQELEIRPQKLPREHSRYRSNEIWPFQVLYQRQPLANAVIAFESSNGTKTSYTSDANGVIQLEFPNDFKAQEQTQQGHAGHHRRRKANFVLAVNHDNHLSAFNYSYSPDAYANKSQIMGLGFLLLGMLVASPLVLRKKEAKS